MKPLAISVEKHDRPRLRQQTEPSIENDYLEQYLARLSTGQDLHIKRRYEHPQLRVKQLPFVFQVKRERQLLLSDGE
jgi:hypothetical protein